MAVIALTSAKGAPGVTTTALVFALGWPRPVLLLEADVAGGSSILAGYLRGSVRHDIGLVDLALAHRRGTLTDALHTASFELPGSQARLLPGLASPAQAGSLQPVWEDLAVVLRGLDRTGTDVLIDAGRLGTGYHPAPLLRDADLTLLVTRTNLPAVAATRARATTLRSAPTGLPDDAGRLQLLLVGEGQPYTAREITAAVGLPVASSIGWDPVNAEVLSLGATPGRRYDSCSLVRTATAAAAAVRHQLTAGQGRLDPGQLVDPAEQEDTARV